MIEELSRVALRVDRPLLKLCRGDVGTVVYAYAMGDLYEVEFLDSNGQTRAVATLHRNELRIDMSDEFTTLMHSEWAVTEDEAQQWRAWHVFGQIYRGLSFEQAVGDLGFTRETLAPYLPEWEETYNRKIILD